MRPSERSGPLKGEIHSNKSVTRAKRSEVKVLPIERSPALVSGVLILPIT